MEYTTNLYERNKQKVLKRAMYNLGVLSFIILAIYMFLFGIMGIGLTVFGVAGAIIALIKMKEYDDKYMGITAYGDRKQRFTMTEEYFIIDEAKMMLSELENLIIYVDEYTGMRREILGVHHGGNNEITFSYKGADYKIFYIIRNKSDFGLVEKLVGTIEQGQKNYK